MKEITDIWQYLFFVVTCKVLGLAIWAQSHWFKHISILILRIDRK